MDSGKQTMLDVWKLIKSGVFDLHALFNWCSRSIL